MIFQKASRALALASMLGLTLWAAPGAVSAQPAAASTVRIENFSFVPDTITVPVGTTITWENGDDIPHSIVLSDKSFRSKPLDTHDTAMFKFTKVGEITYFCGLHPHMQGKIIVVP
jgi:plastocyanin